VVTDGNYKLFFDKENRVALHEHITCPPKADFYMSDDFYYSREMTPEEKQNFFTQNNIKY
jgi:hypothetical protein